MGGGGLFLESWQVESGKLVPIHLSVYVKSAMQPAIFLSPLCLSLCDGPVTRLAHSSILREPAEGACAEGCN